MLLFIILSVLIGVAILYSYEENVVQMVGNQLTKYFLLDGLIKSDTILNRGCNRSVAEATILERLDHSEDRIISVFRRINHTVSKSMFPFIFVEV